MLSCDTLTTMQERAWWVRLPDGSRRRFGPAGVLIGRDPDCDIVVSDPAASRRQTMLYVSADGPQVVPLGRGRTEVSGQAVAALANLDHGDEVRVPGLCVTVEGEELPAEDGSAAVWVVEFVGGGMFGVGPRGVRIGSGPNDDVRVESAVDGAVTLRVAQGQLILEADADVVLRGSLVPSGALETLHSGDLLEIGDVKFRVLATSQNDAATQVDDGPDEGRYPVAARLVFLPRGGRLTVTVDGKEHSIYLADRRCDLVANLLKPPSPYQAGDPVPDEVLLARIWPRRDMSASTLSVLLHRVRKDLVRAGIDGGTVITTAPGGGAVRFTLRRGALVEVG